MTPRRLEILRFIDRQIAQGCAPTLQEIADHAGISKITVYEHCGWLVDRGYIRRPVRRGARNQVVTDLGQRALHPPIVADPVRDELEALRTKAPPTKFGQEVCSVIDRLLTPAAT